MAIEIRVIPTQLMFIDEESYFQIYRCNVNKEDASKVKLNNYNQISLKGYIPKLEIGGEYRFTVTEEPNDKYGVAYFVQSMEAKRPETAEEQKEFLKTILTENQVKNIYKAYGEDADILGLIERQEFDYNKVQGLGEKTYQKLLVKINENLGMSSALAFLGKYGIKYKMISKLVKEYGNPQIVIDKIRENPYILAKEVRGIGFIKADEIALSMGYEKKSPHRIRACVKHVIEEENQKGHSWIDYKQLLNRATSLLDISKKYIIEVLNNDIEGVVKISGERFTTEYVYKCEKYIAEKIIEFNKNSKPFFEKEELDRMLDEYCRENNVELEENQRQFFYNWNENNVSLLIGNAGTGKTWLQKILLNFLDKKDCNVTLLSPTGKASKVQSEYTGKKAYTIHRRIRAIPSDENEIRILDTIDSDVVIVDESSMCDIFILSKLFKAIVNQNAKILFVGDDFQLPSVGVGNFLYDLINSGFIKISKLKKVFRQDDGGILDVATQVRKGMLFLNNHESGRKQFGKDCVFWLVNQEYIFSGIIKNYKNVLKKYDQEDVIILTPTNKGRFGTVYLNKEIQKIANPPSPDKKEKVVGKKDDPTIFRVGDIVMNTENTYGIETVDGGKADIFNGDTGKIVDINEEEKVLIINFDGILIKMDFKDILNNLKHAWVMTIHKSQGSGYKCVIVILDKSMKFQFNANLIYTGFTRAKECMLVLGQAESINYGIKKFANMERRSLLREFILTNFSQEVSILKKCEGL